MSETNSKRLIKPMDIDIYGDLQRSSEKLKAKEPSEPCLLENYVSIIRKELVKVAAQTRQFKESALHIVSTGKAHMSSSIITLQEEKNLPAQLGVIAAGSLFGYLVGVARGRFLKRTFYTTLGFVGSASLCYPEEAKEYYNIAYKEGEQYGKIAYNFAEGVVREDLGDTLKTIADIFTAPSKDSEKKPDDKN